MYVCMYVCVCMYVRTYVRTHVSKYSVCRRFVLSSPKGREVAAYETMLLLLHIR